MPSEVLRQILLAIDGEFSKTLWSVCLTCKQLRAIVEEYCEPKYNVRGTIIKDPFALMERILAQPSLRFNIRAARIEFNYDTKHTEEVGTLITSLGLEPLRIALINDWIYESLRDGEGLVWLAALLPRLEIIEVSSTTPNSRGYWPRLITLLDDAATGNRLSSHGFRHLYSLTLRYPPWFCGNYHSRFYNCLDGGVLQLPKLKRLVLNNVMFRQEGSPSVFEGKSSVEELHIPELQEYLKYHEYSVEWGIFKGLKILHLHIIDQFLGDKKDCDDSPQYVSDLQSQAHSLEDLRIFSNEQYCTSNGALVKMSPFCLYQPSLKHFQKLKSLALADMALVGVSTDGPTHWHQSFKETLDHLADMFPSTSEVLTHLVWDGPSGFAASVPPGQQMSHSWENVWKASPKDRFPNLKTVMVQKYGLTSVADGGKVIWRRKM
ncbi:hypothetical protein B5807_04563 [Epicoccum nigrum]|uniref:F-box domain-containing protein n=1 Tax=Epicoccum nigrum TaxID=105696 RepID=A0A1Y2M4T7_EPING|nr:hypothetical protein B5807_04563 [Epicoccum nigrum]